MSASTTSTAPKTPGVKSKSSAKTSKTERGAHPRQPVVDSHRFPFAQYASVLGVHVVLVGFTALYLPQTTRLFAPLAVRETDKPQSEFMEALTANPCLTLCWTSTGLTLLQVWWANWVRKWSFEQTTKESEVDVKLDRIKFDGLRFMRLRDATAFTLCAAVATHVIVVLFGAPLATHISQTALLAFVIAVLTVFTPAFVLGIPSLGSDTPSTIRRLTWTRLFAELSPKSTVEYVLVYPALGTCIGGWVGAIPIALDWDRPWQAWPLTSLFGCIGGYIVGALLSFAFNATRWLAAEHIRSQSQPSKPKSS